MKKMKKLMIVIVLALLVGGCGSPGADIGLGAGLGAGLSNLIAGGEKDLVEHEQKLIAAYNTGVEQGMAKENLDQIEQDIYDTRLSRQTLSEGKGLLDLDWKDPKQSGAGIGIAASLVFAWLNRKKRIQTQTALKEVVTGGQKLKTTSPESYATFKAAQAQSTETKKMVALLKVS